MVENAEFGRKMTVFCCFLAIFFTRKPFVFDVAASKFFIFAYGKEKYTRACCWFKTFEINNLRAKISVKKRRILLRRIPRFGEPFIPSAVWPYLKTTVLRAGVILRKTRKRFFWGGAVCAASEFAGVSVSERR